MKGFAIALLLVACLGTSWRAAAHPDGSVDSTPAESPSRQLGLELQENPGKFPSYLCGNLCLYAFAKRNGIDTELAPLIDFRYLGKKGAPLGKLQEAAESIGVYAKPLKNITAGFLRETFHDIILHVKSDPAGLEYDHYVLFQGMEGENLRILDLPNDLALIPFSEFAARWDGYGLVLSTEPLEGAALMAPVWQARMRYWFAIAFGAAMVLLIKRYNSARASLRPLPILQHTAILLLCCVVVATLFHSIGNAGLLRASAATAQIQEAHFNHFLRHMDRDDLKASLADGNTVVIDARYAKDFNIGHLPGAINVPVNANTGSVAQLMAGIQGDRRIVIYCQSSSCPFSNVVAKKLTELGYANLFIYKGGWREWQEP